MITFNCLSISFSKILSSKGLEITIPNKAAKTILGVAAKNCRKKLPDFRMEATMNRSRLKIINPHKIPNPDAAQKLSKTEYKAYPEDKAAKIAVNRITPPIPACLLISVGDFSSSLILLPEQTNKNFSNQSIKRYFVLQVSIKYRAKY